MPKRRNLKGKPKPIQCDAGSPLDIDSMFVIDKTADSTDVIQSENMAEALEHEEANRAKRTKISREEMFEKKRLRDEKDEHILSTIIFNQTESKIVLAKDADNTDSDSELNNVATLTPAWNDNDDETHFTRSGALQQTMRERLQERFEDTSGGRPSWGNRHIRRLYNKQDCATADSDSDDELEHLLLKKTKLTERPSMLKPSFISLTQLSDANKGIQPDAVMRCVEFHPTSQLLLSAGFHKTLDIYQIEGKHSNRIQGVCIENFPIYTAHFAARGEEIILNSNKPHFFVYNLQTDKIQKIYDVRGHQKEFFKHSLPSPSNTVIAFLGKDGYIVLLSAKTKQWISDLKMNGTARCAAFAKNGNIMLTGGSDGEVYVWDMNTRDCVNKFRDFGCGVIHSISASSGDSPTIAVGSDSGIVNVYDSSCLYATQTPKPVKIYKNLTTSITGCTFSPTNEILAFFSYRNKQAIRIAHSPTQTVFSNWPRQENNLSFVNALDFSYNSKYLALGNDLGRVLVYKLNHFLDK